MNKILARSGRKATIWILAVALVLSVTANVVQVVGHTEPQLALRSVQTAYPVIVGFSAMASDDLSGVASNQLSAKSNAAAVAWSQSTGAIQAAAPALTELGIPDVPMVVQEYQQAYDDLPTAGSVPLTRSRRASFAEARRFISLASEVLPPLRELKTQQSLKELQRAFSALAKRGSFIVPEP